MKRKPYLTVVHSDTLSCEPIVRRMPDGALLLAAQCGDDYEPAPLNRVVFFRSEDNGRSWSAPRPIRQEDGCAVYCTELSVLDGTATAYLTLHDGRFLNWKSERMVSRDGGRSWTSCGPEPHLPTFTFHRGVLRLRSGAVLVPFQHYPISAEENARLLRAAADRHGRGAWIGRFGPRIDHVENGVLRSTDGGRTFARCDAPPYPIFGESGNPWTWTEPTLAELSDGRIVMLIRTTHGVLWQSESADGGVSWAPWRPTSIPNPGSKPKLIALSGGRIALVHEPCAERRNPLAVWVSEDDMRTWRHRIVLSDFPLRFDYPDGFWEDGHLYLSIELSRRDILFFDVPLP